MNCIAEFLYILFDAVNITTLSSGVNFFENSFVILSRTLYPCPYPYTHCGGIWNTGRI